MTTTESEPDTRRRDPILRVSIPARGVLGDVQVEWLFATTDVFVYWGDPSPRELLALGHRLTHHYARLGAYKIGIRRAGGHQDVLAEAQIIIRDHVPAVAVTRDPDNSSTVIATASSTLDDTSIIPRYRIWWNYGRSKAAPLYDDFWGMPGASVRREMAPGTYTARITDLGTLWRTDVEYTVPQPTLAAQVAVSGRSATLTVTKATTGKDLVVNWGFGTITEPVTGNTATHAYPADADAAQLVQLAYADASETIVLDTTLESAS